MKRRFTILSAALALLVMLAIPMGMWGQTTTSVTFSELGYSNAESLDGVTISLDDKISCTFDKGTGNNPPAYYTTGTAARLYGKNTLTVTPASGCTITGMTLTFSSTSYTGTLSPSVGNYSLSSSTGTWTGTSTNAVVITNTATNGHARLQVLSVTYSSGGQQTTTYTVTYNSNVAGTAPVVDTYTEGANVTLRAAHTFTNEGYSFSEWNTQADGDGDAYDAGDVIENIQANIELYAIWTENLVSDEQWVLTSLADLTTTDVFVIVGNNGSNYAMKNTDASNSGPAAIAVTVSGTELSGTVPDNIKWNISGNATDGYIFYPNGSTTTWLYCTNNNNGLRIGSGNMDYYTFEIKASYIYNKGRGRYVGIYNSTDWRSYTSSGGNIANQTFAFYKKVTGDVLPPSITASNLNIAYDATSGEIEYTLTNPATNGNLSVSENVDWINNAAVNTSESKVTFTTTANEATTAREGVITLTYTYGNNETVTKDVTVTQAAAPMIYTTIPALFEAATSTATDVTITFGSWVISAVHNSNAYLTDNQGHGLIIYASDHGFQVNDVLTGTVNCKLQTYRGSAELTELTSSVEGLSVSHNGTVAEQNIAINTLGGVNTGALLAYQGLTYNGTALVDGNNNTITPYTTLYSYTFEEGKTYNVKGIYLQYNSTKEILPRSAADIVEMTSTEPSITVTPTTLDVDANQHAVAELIIAYENIDIEGYGSFNIQCYNAEGVAQDRPDWIVIRVTGSNDNGYQVNGYIEANEGEARTVYFKVYAYDAEDNEVYSNLVTITQAAYVAPITGDKYVKVSSADELTSGQYLIVYEEGSVAFDGGLTILDAVGNTIDVVISVEEIAVTNETTAAEFTIDMTAGTIKSASGYYIGQTATSNGLASSTTVVYTNSISIDSDENANIVSSGNHHLRYNNASNQTRFRYYKSDSYASQKAIQLYKKVVARTIEGYGDNSNPGGYYLIASPFGTINPESVPGMLSDTYDLYYFDQDTDGEGNEWINYKGGSFNLEPGKGYLYAHNSDITLNFTGMPVEGTTYEVTLRRNQSARFKGWNLVGNPFAQTAWVDTDHSYYTMNEAGTAFVPATNNSIEAMEGIFVEAKSDEETITFSTSDPNDVKCSTLALNLSQGNGLMDRAIVRFDNGGQLPKLQFNRNSTKVYIPMDDEDYAVVRGEEMGEMPVNFKAESNGTYSLNFGMDNVEFAYLHLIDNLTGKDVDLLQNPNYSFEAKTTDYESRFKLVFATGDNSNDDNFAFYSNGSFVINNEGNTTLQVIDVTGRIVKCESISGCANVNVNAAPGVYMLRLVNGDNVKVQKVVVR